MKDKGESKKTMDVTVPSEGQCPLNGGVSSRSRYRKLQPRAPNQIAHECDNQRIARGSLVCGGNTVTAHRQRVRYSASASCFAGWCA